MEKISARKLEIDPDTLEQIDGHWEFVNGKLVIRNYTSPQHNRFEARIADALRKYISDNNRCCEVFTDSVALLCSELSEECTSDYFLPDVMLVCDPESIDRHGVHSVPEIVAEITSPATRSADYCEKMLTYKMIGVPEYWVIDLQENRATRYLLSDGYVPEYYIHPKTLDIAQAPNLCIEVSDLWG